MNMIIKWMITVIGALLAMGCRVAPQTNQGGVFFQDDSIVDLTIPDRPSEFRQSDRDIISSMAPSTPQAAYIPATGIDHSLTSPNPKRSCGNPEVKFVETNIDPLNPNSNFYRFHYQHVIKDSKLPTYIFIQGGPGNDGIYAREDLKEVFPGNIIFVDPRGLGCNIYKGAYDSFLKDMSSVNYAHDILQVIKKEKLNHYIIVGSSYGTKVSTMIAHFAEKYDMVPPSSVVLSGVMGIHEFTKKGYYYFLHQVWKLINAIPGFSFLRNATRTIIQRFGVSPAELTDIVSQRIRGNVISLFTEILYLGNEDSFASDQTEFTRRMNEFRGFRSGPAVIREEILGKDEIFLNITCRERPRTELDEIYFDASGEMNFNVKNGIHYCDANYRGVRNELYTPADYPVKLPIVYFQGSLDPATSHAWAKTHHDAQLKVNDAKYFVSVESGGHGTIFSELADCREELFIEIMKKNFNFSSILDSTGNCKK